MDSNELSSKKPEVSVLSQSFSAQLGSAVPSSRLGQQVKNSNNNTFSFDTIVPPTRIVKVNQYCYAIYSTLHKIPLAVHQFLDKTIVQGNANREGKDFKQQTQGVQNNDLKFFPDSSYYENTNAYKTMSYDKGHMAPSNNYCGSQELLDSTFTYANCVPQNSYFNRGSWKNLQSYCRSFVRQDLCETIQVISGPVFYSGLPYRGLANLYQNQQVVMLQNGIVVPPKCYKIIKANVSNISYVSAFILENEKKIDTDIKIKSTVVDINQLEYITGLRFNLGKYRPLEQLDPVGMEKTFGDLNLQFYTRLYKNGKTVADMNGARIQALTYKVKVDLQAVPRDERIKIANTDYENIIQQVGWKPSKSKARRKIYNLMNLHKDSTQIKCLSEQLDKNITKIIEDNLQAAKNQDQKQYGNYITTKLYKNNYGYHYPCQAELKKIFPPAQTKKVFVAIQPHENNLQEQFSNLTLEEQNTSPVKSQHDSPNKIQINDEETKKTSILLTNNQGTTQSEQAKKQQVDDQCTRTH